MKKALVLAAVIVGFGCRAPDGPAQARLSLVETLAGGDTVGYARAIRPRTFDFPGDHGPHPGFRTEWWYVTGNLGASGGRDFGFQFTVFRSALAPLPPETESRWGTNQAYMAHFAVTDVRGETFMAFERFGRGDAGLAGATTDPMRVWLDDWELRSSDSSAFPMALTARQARVGLDLELQRGKPVVYQGEGGLSRKGPEPGNASYYYSHTRMPAAGTLVLGSDTLEVRGAAWLDREWSTSALGEGQVGWDWLALQLDDGWDVMVYRLRRADGTADSFSDGVVVAPDGTATRLDWRTDVSLERTATWRSPIDDAAYPAGWRLRVPSRGWDLTVEPATADQELDLTFRYWEGAVRVAGVGEGGRDVLGRGYVELTGYAGAIPTR